MGKREKMIITICAAVFVIGAILLFLIPQPGGADSEKESDTGMDPVAENGETWEPGEGSQAGCRTLLSNTLEDYKQTGRDSMTLQEAVPFPWDELRMEGEDYIFYQKGKAVYCYKTQEEKDFKLLFNYRVHDPECLKREETVRCRLTVRQGVPTLRIHNERYGRLHAGQEGVWNTGEGDETEISASGGNPTSAAEASHSPASGDLPYAYDVTVQDPQAADCDNPQVGYFTEDNNKIRGIRELANFSYDKKGRPVAYSGGTDPVTAVWNEKKNFWKSEENTAIKKVQESLNTTVQDIAYWAEKERYTAVCSRGAVIYDGSGRIHHVLSLEDLAESEGFYEIISSPYEQIKSICWISENIYGIAVCREEDDSGTSGGSHKGYYVLYDFKQEKTVKYFDLQACQYMARDGCLYQAMFENNDFYIRRTHLLSGEEESIPCRNLKLAPTGFQNGLTKQQVIPQNKLLQMDVYQGQIYLLTKAGLYLWSGSIGKWQLIMDGTYMSGLSREGLMLERFRMNSQSEFYVYAKGVDGVSEGFYHYMEVGEEPLTMATDDLNIQNGAVTEFCGRLDDGGRIDLPKGVMRIADSAFAQKTAVPDIKRRRRLVLYYEHSRDPEAFRDCVPIQVEMSKFKQTVHAFYFSGIENEGVRVVLSRKLKKFDAEQMNGTVEWMFYGKVPPEVVNREDTPEFLRMEVPRGTKEEYIRAFGLPGYMENRVVERD